MKKSLLALLLGTSVALAACGGGEEAEQEPADTKEETTEQPAEEPADNGGGETANAAAGEEIYQANCLSCHGENLEGGFGPALDKAGAEHSKEEILEIIKNGQGQMPPNIVEGEDAEAVAEWLANKK
ncbi:MAG TPA: cytochrome c [Chondromyces sp.]|nr:cytochrome c [Chondromyces sp.]